MTDNSPIKKVRIVEIVNETIDAKTFVLEPVGGWEPLYKPGQFLTLVFYTKHGEKRRSYSISSSPDLHEKLRITVKKVDNGEFSRLLIQHAKPGDELYTSGVSGLFNLPEESTDVRHFCFLAAGSGIVPCFSLIKTILAGRTSKIVLFYSNKNKEGVIFYDALLALQQTYRDRLEIRFLFSESNDIYNKRLSKWLLEQLLDQHLGANITNTLFYLCGPFEYMQAAEITLLMYTTRDKIIKENFSSLPRLVIPRPPDTDKHSVTIHINGSVHKIDVQYPNSILVSARLNHVELPYSCGAGRCSSCIATCTKGKVWMAYNEVLVDREIEKGRILTCQGFPIGGDAEIRFE